MDAEYATEGGPPRQRTMAGRHGKEALWGVFVAEPLHRSRFQLTEAASRFGPATSLQFTSRSVHVLEPDVATNHHARLLPQTATLMRATRPRDGPPDALRAVVDLGILG